MASTAPAFHGWTYQKYLELDDDQRYEIIDGELPPAPTSRHQRAVREFSLCLGQFVRERDPGEVLFAPLDVVLSDTKVVQPDILFVGRERIEIIKERGVFGAPDQVVQVLSPTSIHRDRHRKEAPYEQAGVRELWLVDPANRMIEVFGLGEQGYELVSFAAERGQVSSHILEGFMVEVVEIVGA